MNFINTQANVLENLRLAALEQNVYLLENDEVVINGVRFLGCTLWTDFCLYGEGKQAKCMDIARELLNDFALISEHGLPFTPEHSLIPHHQSKDWLSKKLINETFAGKTVVVTHHCPSWNTVAPKYQSNLLSAYFASPLEQLLGKSELWMHGHTHVSFDYDVHVTRVVCNPRSYVLRGNFENSSFNPTRIVSSS